MLPTTPIQHFWFSIMLGWFAKVLVVRLGGAAFYQGARPFFQGLIIGEIMAAAFWMLMSVLLHASGVEFQTVRILP
jgi:hypothetical protein